MSTTAVNASPAPSDMDSHEGVAPRSVLPLRVCCPLIMLPALSLVLSPECGHSAHRSCHPSLSLLPGGTIGNVCFSHYHLVLSVFDNSCALLLQSSPPWATSLSWMSFSSTYALSSVFLSVWNELGTRYHHSHPISEVSSCSAQFLG